MFPKLCYTLTMEIPICKYLYDRDTKKLTLKNFKMESKTDIYTINKNNNKSNKKNRTRITFQSF